MRRALQGLAVVALLAVGAIHLYLYLHDGYRHIPTIGPLFLVTVAAAAVTAVALAVRPLPIVALGAAGFALGTLAGYVLTLTLPKGLFLFREPSISTPGWLSIIAEAVVVLVAGALALHGRSPSRRDTPLLAGSGRRPHAARPV